MSRGLEEGLLRMLRRLWGDHRPQPRTRAGRPGPPGTSHIRATRGSTADLLLWWQLPPFSHQDAQCHCHCHRASAVAAGRHGPLSIPRLGLPPMLSSCQQEGRKEGRPLAASHGSRCSQLSTSAPQGPGHTRPVACVQNRELVTSQTCPSSQECLARTPAVSARLGSELE